MKEQLCELQVETNRAQNKYITSDEARKVQPKLLPECAMVQVQKEGTERAPKHWRL